MGDDGGESRIVSPAGEDGDAVKAPLCIGMARRSHWKVVISKSLAGDRLEAGEIAVRLFSLCGLRGIGQNAGRGTTATNPYLEEALQNPRNGETAVEK